MSYGEGKDCTTTTTIPTTTTQQSTTTSTSTTEPQSSTTNDTQQPVGTPEIEATTAIPTTPVQAAELAHTGVAVAPLLFGALILIAIGGEFRRRARRQGS